MSSFDPTYADDNVSLGSVSAPIDDVYGQSVGRISVHSVSRLISDEDDGGKLTETGSPSDKDNSRSEAPGASIVQSEINFKSSVTEAPGSSTDRSSSYPSCC